jgi:phospholipase C
VLSIFKSVKKRITTPLLNWSTGISLILIIAVIGTSLLIASHALTPNISVEPETGTLSSGATSSTDSTASGGAAVKFPAPATATVSATTPCVHAAAPAKWKHVVLIMFENEVASDIIGTSQAPWITSMARACGSSNSWHDGNYRVDGTTDGNYPSKPSYATLTSGVSPSVSGIKNDTYSTTTSVDNLFNRLNSMGLDTKSYQSGPAGQCAVNNFSGAYHDAMRYYTNLGGQSASSSTYCNQHDVAISSFMADVNAGHLPAFSLILPTNDQNMHNNSIQSGDSWAKDFLTPFLSSAQYKSGDTALFFLWDEETPIPNVLFAPSIKPGSTVVGTGSTYPISHFSFTRTTQEMLGMPTPLLGVSNQAPSLLNYFNGN